MMMAKNAANTGRAALDSFDKALLDQVQRDNRQSHEALGHAVGLSSSSVRRRLARLRAEGVIVADVSLLDPAALGVTVIVSIRFEKESHRTYEDFKKQMRAASEVQQCYTVSGEVDFIVIAHFPSVAIYEQWIADYLLGNDALQRSDTNIVYSRVKYDTAVPVGE